MRTLLPIMPVLASFAFGLVLSTFLAVSQAAQGDGPKKEAMACLEVDMRPEGEWGRLSVFIRNVSTELFSFDTGAGSGPGSLDDRTKRVIGGPPTVIPEVTIALQNWTYVILRPPAFGGMISYRGMRPWIETVRPGERLEYASFAVPQVYLQGKVLLVKLRLLDGRELGACGGTGVEDHEE